MRDDKTASGSAVETSTHSRRDFLSWLGGVTALGLGGFSAGISGAPAAHAASAHAASAQAAPSSSGFKLGAVKLTEAQSPSVAAGVLGAAVPALPTYAGGRSVLDQLTLQSFVPFINSQFQFREAVSGASARTVELELVEARNKQPRHERAGATEAFVLVFRGSGDSPLEQNTYEVQHMEIGNFPLFIVPIGQDDNGRYYQAIFNRLRSA